MGKRYSVNDDTQFSMMDTDSFREAIKYASLCKWTVFDNLNKAVVYDGARDELTIMCSFPSFSN